MRKYCSIPAAFLCVSLVNAPLIAQQSQNPAQSAPASSAAGSPEQPRVPLPNTLMDGTAVKLRLAQTISSADAHVGQQIPFETTEDIFVQGVLICPKGSPALGTVTNAVSKKSMGRGGKLDVNIDSVRLTDGEKVQLRAVQNTKGGGHVGAMTGAMVATSIVFFPAAPLFLFIKGKDITIPQGTEITAFVQGDTRIDMSKFGAVSGTVITTPTNEASLTVESSSPGADISIDGNFVGNTPSTVSVVPGQHTIVVSKKGYKEWSRTMNVAGSGVKLSADMEKTN